MENIEQILGSDLAKIVNELDGGVESAEDITRLRSTKNSKACFRLRLRDGRTYKGRRFRTEGQQKSVTGLLQLLDGLPFSRVIAATGIASVEEWIHGSPVQPEDINAEHTRDLATVLGTLHSTKYFRENQLAGAPDSGWYFERMKKHLTNLHNRGHLESVTVDDLIGQAEHNRPGTLEAGLIHSDYHPGNMVTDPDGEIWIIDNEGIRLGALDYDVAKCWRHWPMTHSQRDVFCSAYSKFRSLDAFMAHQKFWAICTLAVTANIHNRYGRSNDRFIEKLYRISQNAGELLWPELGPERQGQAKSSVT